MRANTELTTNQNVAPRKRFSTGQRSDAFTSVHSGAQQDSVAQASCEVVWFAVIEDSNGGSLEGAGFFRRFGQQRGSFGLTFEQNLATGGGVLPFGNGQLHSLVNRQ